MGVAITGLVGLWSVCTKKVMDAREVAVAAQLARAELERAKVLGYRNMPKGQFSTSSGTALWRGAFSPTVNAPKGSWVSGGTSYFDFQGKRVSSTSPTVKFSVQTQVTDADVMTVSSGGYELGDIGRRTATVTVRRVSDSAAITTMGTILVRGGV
jgi:hypothetical protein